MIKYLYDMKGGNLMAKKTAPVVAEPTPAPTQLKDLLILEDIPTW